MVYLKFSRKMLGLLDEFNLLIMKKTDKFQVRTYQGNLSGESVNIGVKKRPDSHLKVSCY